MLAALLVVAAGTRSAVAEPLRPTSAGAVEAPEPAPERSATHDERSLLGVDSLDLDLRVQLEMPTWNDLPAEGDLLHQVALAEDVPGQVVVRYGGLQGFVVKHINRRLSSEWSRSLNALYRGDVIDEEQLARMQEARDNAMADQRAGGRWWERRWYHSLTPELGGVARPTLHRVGHTTEVLRWGPLSLNNQFRMRIDGAVAVSLFEPAQRPAHLRKGASGLRATDHARLARSLLDPEAEQERALSRRAPDSDLSRLPTELDLWIGLQPSGRWLEGVSWTLKLRPQGRVSLRSSGLDGSLRLRASLEVSSGLVHKRPVLHIEGELEYEPLDGELKATFEVALLAW